MALLSIQGSISISQSSFQKTMTRFAGENSLCASISNLALIGSTHFIPLLSSNDARLGLILGGTLFYARVTFKTLAVFNFKVP